MTIQNARESTADDDLLYGLDNMCCGKTSFGGLYSRGHYLDGVELTRICIEKVRKMMERCDVPSGFLLCKGLGGGTGSGMGSLLMNDLRE